MIEKSRCFIRPARGQKGSKMKKVLKPAFFFILSFALFAAAARSVKTNGGQARKMFENAVLSPEQAFPDAKTFYMKTVKNFESLQFLQNHEETSYAADVRNMPDENTEYDEYWHEGNKIRFSNHVNKPPVTIETHLVFDGKTLAVLSNMAPKKQTELGEEAAKRLMSATFSDILGRTSEGAVRYSFKGSAKAGDFDCYVIGLYLTGEKEILKNLFYIDKKTNVVVRAESHDSDDVIYEVKKIGRIDNRFFPAAAEISVKNISNITLSYDVKANEAIDPAVFDISKLSAEVETRRAQQNQFMQELAKKMSEQTTTMIENALNAASSTGAAEAQSVLTNALEVQADEAETQK